MNDGLACPPHFFTGKNTESIQLVFRRVFHSCHKSATRFRERTVIKIGPSLLPPKKISNQLPARIREQGVPMYNSFQPFQFAPPRNPMIDPAAADKARAALREILVTRIRDVVKQRRMTHTAASFDTRVGRTVITAILNGNLNKISTDRLLRIAYRLGLKIELKVSLE